MVYDYQVKTGWIEDYMSDRARDGNSSETFNPWGIKE